MEIYSLLLGQYFIVSLLINGGLLLLIVPGIIVMCIFFISDIVLMLEKVGIGKSLSVGYERTQGNLFNVFLVVIFCLLFLIPSFIITSYSNDLSGTNFIINIFAGLFETYAMLLFLGAGFATYQQLLPDHVELRDGNQTTETLEVKEKDSD